MSSLGRWCWLLLVAACGSDPMGTGDGGPDARDAVISDSNITLDGSTEGGRDSGPGDAAPTVSMCSTATCDPRASTGCTGELACVLAGAQASCAVAAGESSVGEPCDAPSDCGEGSACFSTRGERGVCGKLCCPDDPSSCARLETCGGTPFLVDGTRTAWARCIAPRTCDVLAQDDCEPGEGCYIVSAEGATECRRAGDAAEGEPCAEQHDCESGLFCGGLAVHTCARICRIDSEDGQCPGSTSCVAYAHSPPGTGVCTRDQSYP